MELSTVSLDLPAGSKFPPILLFYHPSMKELACKIDQMIKDGVKEREKKRNDEIDVRTKNISTCVNYGGKL